MTSKESHVNWDSCIATHTNHLLVYVIVWLAVVFGINSASNAGRKIVIVQGAAEYYYNFHTCIASTINSKYYSNHTVTD